MELKSVSGFTCYVKDLTVTAAFYEALGFRMGNRDEVSLRVYLNWFSLTFVDQDKAELQKEAHLDNRGIGIFVNIKVDDVDEFYKGILKLGMKPSGEPKNWPWGNREFALRDPDGYRLVFFSNVRKHLEN